MNDYLVNGVESSWEDIIALARARKLRNIDKTSIRSLVETLRIKGYDIRRIPQDSPELL